MAGTRWEREAKDMLEEQGYVTGRATSSLGAFDIWGIGGEGKQGHMRCIEVKKVKYQAAYKNGRRNSAAKKLAELPLVSGVSYEVWVYEGRVGWEKYKVEPNKGLIMDLEEGKVVWEL